MIQRLKKLVGKVETRALVVLLLLAGLPWLFLNVAGEVSDGDTDVIDRRLLLALRNPVDPSDPIGPLWVEEALRDVTALGGFTVLTLVTVVAALLLIFHGRRRQALVFTVTVVAAQLSSELLKTLYDRDRPALVSHGSYVYSQSFPSGHATTAFAVCFVVSFISPRWFPWMLLFAITIGLSRIVVGAHYPTDTIAGALVGALGAYAVRNVFASRGWVFRRHPDGRIRMRPLSAVKRLLQRRS